MSDKSDHGTPTNQPTAIYGPPPTGEDKFVDQRWNNVRSDVIEVTHDKLENVLLKFYQNYTLRSAWFNPLSLFAAVLLTMVTADFKALALGVEGATWKALFIFLGVASVLWLIWSVVRLARCWKETTLDFLISKIKNDTSPRK